MIRHAKPSEIEKIITITQACAAHMQTQGIFQWNEEYPSLEAFQKDLDQKELYVLLEKNEVIGCICIASEKDSEYNDVQWLTQDTYQYYIHRLAVHPSHQGRGHAQQLMDFAETKAKVDHVASVRLDTFSLNKRNQRFYEQRGYTRLGSIYFPKQSDAPFYCYELVLNG
ncbi:GNAT family N-acetyltransferase [Altibacter sp.]|uniref:GNAT family N-acetyltransferase n=1 Tax=Altibacter sp. TaxID=2024823 RepID=UPI00258A2D2D|nr:GNAT family N-acetyltransferase [Altibacter sp.]MCW9037042.1 GNAT family N-acetyltransferase [Altibacter sp.]